MNEIQLREMVNDKLGNKKELFIKFFMSRFPNENPNITSYVNEWIDRFNGGNPSIYMDESSLEIYNKLL